MGAVRLSIEEQIEHLKARGLDVDDDTPSILLSENYYSVVNGYKDPFLGGSSAHGVAREYYARGARFSDIYALFSFDRDLRVLTFQQLVPVEAMVRSLCSYRFTEAHCSEAAYLSPRNYTSLENYLLDSANYSDNLAGIIGTLTRRAADKANQVPYIDHYRDTYGQVPLWVLVNDITFGEIRRFFSLMNEREQTAVCKDIATLTNRLGDRELGYLGPSEMLNSLDLLVKVRNVCVHDDRLYCGRFGPHREAGYREFLMRLRRFVPQSDFDEFIVRVGELIDAYSKQSELVAAALTKTKLLP